MVLLQINQQVFQAAILIGLFCIIVMMGWLVGYFYARERRREYFNDESTEVPELPARKAIIPKKSLQPAIIAAQAPSKKQAKLELDEDFFDDEAEPTKFDRLLGWAQKSVGLILLIGFLGVGGYFGYQEMVTRGYNVRLPGAFAANVYQSAKQLVAKGQTRNAETAPTIPDEQPSALAVSDEPAPTQPADTPSPESTPSVATTPSSNLSPSREPPAEPVALATTGLVTYSHPNIPLRFTYDPTWLIEPFNPTWNEPYDPDVRLWFRLVSPSATPNLQVRVDANPKNVTPSQWIGTNYSSAAKTTRQPVEIGNQSGETMDVTKGTNRKLIYVFGSERLIYTFTIVMDSGVGLTDPSVTALRNLVSTLELR